MKLRVYDYHCTDETCPGIIENLTIDEESGTTFVDDIPLSDLKCPLCGSPVEKSQGMIPPKHISWSSWRIDHK